MFGLEESQLWPAAIGCIVLGSMMIAVALYIAVFFVDWKRKQTEVDGIDTIDSRWRNRAQESSRTEEKSPDDGRATPLPG